MSTQKRPSFDLSSFSDLTPELVEVMVSVACDIALILDDGGVIQNVAVGHGRAAPAEAHEWIGQRWADTVTVEMREKVAQFLSDLSDNGVSRTRHLAHESDEGLEIPMAYSAIRLGDQGPTLAIGRDMRLVSAMQERITQTQRTMERDYWQRRQTETRYRLLFDVATEPMLIVDAATYTVLDANLAATNLLGSGETEVVGHPLAASIAEGSRVSLHAALDSARCGKLPLTGRVMRLDGRKAIEFNLTALDEPSSNVFFLRLRETPVADAPIRIETTDPSRTRLLEALFERSADVMAVCDLKGNLQFVNEAFLNLAELGRGQEVTGRNLLDWLNGGGVGEILDLVKSGESGRLFAATFKRPNDAPLTVEMSATLLPQHDFVGLIIRVSHTPTADHSAAESFRGVN